MTEGVGTSDGGAEEHSHYRRNSRRCWHSSAAQYHSGVVLLTGPQHTDASKTSPAYDEYRWPSVFFRGKCTRRSILTFFRLFLHLDIMDVTNVPFAQLR